jgi:hypothetical protein
MLYGCSRYQDMQTAMKAQPLPKMAQPMMAVLWRLRMSQRVHGTKTSRRSHEICREVPKMALVTTANQSQATILRPTRSSRARMLP